MKHVKFHIIVALALIILSVPVFVIGCAAPMPDNGSVVDNIASLSVNKYTDPSNNVSCYWLTGSENLFCLK